ncbi:GRAS domain-containing protein [Cephalotus follicularis]|uniref:GRAS domain-containing protein n=1 Tax=Cephalotus follicularis TaxID=3775 RepID=A0A1Q3AVW6_CEPFO|nr:GRAS domain-containing protein [Cephalotus follicularis]
MQTSQKHQRSAAIQGLYHQPVQGIEPYCLSQIQILDNNVISDTSSQGTSVSFQTSQGSQSCLSDPHHSPDNNYGSPTSGSSIADDGSELRHKLRELEISLLGPESDIVDSCNCCSKSGVNQSTSVARWNWSQLIKMLPRLDLKQVLINCAQAIADHDISLAEDIMQVLEQMVSVSGDPIQRLGAYMLEGLRARLELSGSKIYKALRCIEPTSSELMSYMHILYQICPYWKFAYMSANAVIEGAMRNEPRIHIIDFQIAQGSQWVLFIQALRNWPGGPPHIRITGVDDSQSAHARGGRLHIVGQRLAKVAESFNVPFEFHDTAMSSGCKVELESLEIRPGEAVAVNFPYVLHHMPDESVSTWNHRDRLLRLVKSLSPKVVTLVEQESNTNTSPFIPRFLETLDYYTAMFESIDVACPRDDRKRISAEQHCVARDIVNMIACEGEERVERHELFGKWKSRFSMAGFTSYPLSLSVTTAVRNLLKEYNKNYRIEERNDAIYLGWVNRAMATSSAWR